MSSTAAALRSPGTAFALGLALVAAAPAPASACRNGMVLSEDRNLQLLARAERQLAATRYRAALRTVALVQTHDREDVGMGQEGIKRAVRQVEATARLRMLARARPLDLDQLAALTAQLRAIHRTPIGMIAPLGTARLAEALALTADGIAEAASLIELLVRRDVMPEAQGWLTVAKVRAHHGDRAGMADALRRCARMAGPRAWICRRPSVHAVVRTRVAGPRR